MAAALLATFHPEAVAAEIHDAVAEGNLAKVRSLIEKEAPLVNLKDASGGTPLHEAARKGQKAVAEYLLAHKADVNARDATGLTPLKLATGYRHLELVALLEKNGAQSTFSSASKTPPPGARSEFVVESPFIRALEILEDEKAKAMLAANTNLINVTNRLGQTPLQIVARRSNRTYLPMMRVLLSHGARINTHDNQGEGPLLDVAARPDGVPLIEFLLANGAEVDITNNYGQTPLLKASGAIRAIANVRVLLGAKANPNAMSDRKLTPLLTACRENTLDNAEALLTAGANPNVREFGYGATPLHLAVYRNNSALVQLLIAHKADVNAQDADGHTPLADAISAGRMEMVALLKRHGAVEVLDRPIAEPYRSLVATARQIDTAMREQDRDTLKKTFKALEPLPADLKKIFGAKADQAARLVAKESRELLEEVERVRPDSRQPPVVFRFAPIEPTLLASSKALIAPGLLLSSLKEIRRDGDADVGVTYCFVNEHWVRLPSLLELEGAR